MSDVGFDGDPKLPEGSKSVYEGSVDEIAERLSGVGYVELKDLMENVDKQTFIYLLTSKMDQDIIRFPTISLGRSGEEPKVYMLFADGVRTNHASLWKKLEEDGKTQGAEVLFASSFEGVTENLEPDRIAFLKVPGTKMMEDIGVSDLYVPMGRVSDALGGYPFVEKYLERKRDEPIFKNIFEPAGIEVTIKY